MMLLPPLPEELVFPCYSPWECKQLAVGFIFKCRHGSGEEPQKNCVTRSLYALVSSAQEATPYGNLIPFQNPFYNKVERGADFQVHPACC